MLSLGSLAFASPGLLIGFVIVPALWWLLRVTPPAPLVVRFPAIRLLTGLVPQEETPARTPLWLILLRMLLAALLILALAHPLINPSALLPGRGPLVLVIDDDWAAARDWPARQALTGDLIDRAEREGRQVMVVPTAAGSLAEPPSLLRPADARGIVQALRPKPWGTDRAAVVSRLAGLSDHDADAVYWLADGLDDKGPAAALAKRLADLGFLHVVRPEPGDLPHVVTSGPLEAVELTATVRRAGLGDAPPVMLRALAEDGRVLAEAEAHFAADRYAADAAFKLPAELRNRVGRINLVGESDAGATLLIDEQSRRRPVGIVTDRPAGSAQPLLSDSYYLDRALTPFAELRHGSVTELLQRGLSLMILPDGAAEPRQALQAWIEAGGVLLRFAGPVLAEQQDEALLPVTLRQGGRTIGGALSWEKPAHLAAFPAESPFAGLVVPGDVTVDRQVLAEPAVDLAAKTWARLSDGTPLVTAERRGKGWLVLVHTTANTAWSNLPISGLFVDMLRRLVQLGQGLGGVGDAVLAPWQVLDGFARLIPAPAAVQPVAAAALTKTAIGPSHPPGFYGGQDAHQALNLGPSIETLAPFDAIPPGAAHDGYRPTPEFDLRPGLLAAALLLALADLLVGYGLRGLLRPAALAVLLLAGGGSAWAAGPDDFVIAATAELRLAYIRTGDAEIDRVSRAGLAGLGAVLARRTSVEAGEPMAVDVEADELIFFPLIYWPLSQAQHPLSPQAAERVNKYLATGGTILFDTQDQGTSGLNGGDSARLLGTLLAGVQVPALVQIPPEHVLTKSFYLMQDFPGRWYGGTLWVEPVEDRVNDGVSTIIMGSNDWAAAWAIDADGYPSFPVVPGGEPQREQAYRFGVNLVMYALTGNYKADQVHVPAILERLGQ